MSVKTLSRAEVAEHNTSKSLWVVIGNKVYDISKFLDEHPGGCEVLLEQAGQDATEVYEDVGHSTDARKMKDDYYIGDVLEEEAKTYSYDKKTSWQTSERDNVQRGEKGTMDSLIYTALLAVIGVLIYYLFLA